MAKANMPFADGVKNRPAKRFGQSDQHAAQQRARHRAEPAGNDDDEGEQRIGRPERRRDVDQEHDHRAGGAHAGGADPEGERIEALHVQADHEGAGIVVGAGADRGAQPREAEEGEQASRQPGWQGRRA